MTPSPYFGIIKQFIIFSVVGGAIAVADILFIVLLVEVFNVWYISATVLSFLTLTTAGFFVHKSYTFRQQDTDNVSLKLIYFLCVTLSALVLNLILTFILVEIINIWYLIAITIVRFFVAVYNFFLSKIVIFRTERNNAKNP